MDRAKLLALLESVAAGGVPPTDALDRLRHWPLEDLGFARVDHQRALRSGAAETVYGAGKTPAEVAAIAVSLAAGHDRILVTRAAPAAYEALRERLPEAVYHSRSQAIVWQRAPAPRLPGSVLVVAAGTSDRPVAEEAVIAADLLGCRVDELHDVGVAGLHRLLAALDQLRGARVLIVVAGFEGALPSVVAGLVSAPVIAVPTSVGYGAAFGGIAPLLAMLNACAPNVGVVNIDNGFGAASLAAAICRGGSH